MKTKRFEKKLVLTKETIADLKQDETQRVIAGGNDQRATFVTCARSCGTCPDPC